MMMIPNPVAYDVYRGFGVPRVPDGQSYAYLLAGNGVFKLAENAYLRALIPVAACKVAGLPELAPVVQFCDPKMRLPRSLLRTILEHAQRLAVEQPREALYHIRLYQKHATVIYPRQTGTAAHLAYAGGDEPGIVMDVHSHVQMRAFFSDTDNRDEQGFRLYAVLGRIFTRPELALRVGVYGDFWRVPTTMVFGEA